MDLYENGLKFSTILKQNLDDCIELLKQNLPAVIIVDGNAGRGKTTLTIEMGDYVNSKYGQPPLDLETSEQYGMGGKQFLEKLNACNDKGYKYLVYDEGGDFSRRSSLTQFNALLNQAFDMSRALNIIIVISLLRFWFVDQHIFDSGLIVGLVHVKNKKKTYSNFVGFSLYEMLLMKHTIKKLPIPSQVYNFYKPNFYGHFLNLEPDRAAQLDRISIANKKKIIGESQVKMEGLYSKADICKKLYKSASYVNKLIIELKIQPTKKINRINYYDQTSFEKMVEMVDIVKINKKKE